MDKWIIFDLDDVVGNFRDSLYQSFKALNKDIHWSTWDTYDCAKIFQLKDQQELREHMVNYKVLENSTLEPYAKQVFEELKENGYHIGLLTARSWHKQAQKVTEEFVHSYDLKVDRVVISGLHEDKKSLHIPKFTGEIKAYVDDTSHHVEDFINNGVENVFLMDRPWNQSSELYRVNDLKEFQDKILKKPKPRFK